MNNNITLGDLVGADRNPLLWSRDSRQVNTVEMLEEIRLLQELLGNMELPREEMQKRITNLCILLLGHFSDFSGEV